MRFLLTLITFFIVICLHPVNAQLPMLEYEVVTRLEITPVDDISWSPDGSKLAILAFPDIQIWDAQNWDLLLTIPEVCVHKVEWSPDGTMIAGICSETAETLVIWDSATGEMLREMTRPRPDDFDDVLILHDLAWHPDGSKIATDSALPDDILLIWDLESDDNPHTLLAGDATEAYIDVIDIEWSHDGAWLLAEGSDGSIYDSPDGSAIRLNSIGLYDATTGESVNTIPSAYHPIWSGDDQQFAGLSYVDGRYMLTIWQAETGETLSTFESYASSQSIISWNYSANLIAGVRNEGIAVQDNLLIWDIEAGVRHLLPELFFPSVTGIAWQPNGNQLAIADFYDGIVILNFAVDE